MILGEGTPYDLRVEDPLWEPPTEAFSLPRQTRPLTRPRNLYLATTVYPNDVVTQNIFVASSTAAAYLHAHTLLKDDVPLEDVEIFITLERTLRPAVGNV